MGPFDNESGFHIFNQDLFDQAHWYEDRDCKLYIVSDGAEIDGPDTPDLDALNALYRQHESIAKVDATEVAARLGLDFIPHWQRRFDPVKGYYAA